MSRIQQSLVAFQRDLDAFAARRQVDAVKLQRMVTMELLGRVVRKTPVDSGRARNNWQLSNGSPATGVVEGSDRGGNQAISRGTAVVASVIRPTILWLSNNVPYIERLENGYSMQAPAGMLRLSIEELRGMFR